MANKQQQNIFQTFIDMGVTRNPENFSPMTYGAAIGYMMLAVKYLDLSRDDITELKQLMFSMMDLCTHKDAERVFLKQ